MKFLQPVMIFKHFNISGGPTEIYIMLSFADKLNGDADFLGTCPHWPKSWL